MGQFTRTAVATCIACVFAVGVVLPSAVFPLAAVLRYQADVRQRAVDDRPADVVAPDPGFAATDASDGAWLPDAGHEAVLSEDLRGNEVTHAVASYTLDAAGDLYEEHSPGTELLDLGPPET